MSDSSNRARPSSVAAFLFMPQFGQMFRSSSYLVPVFMRTIAQLFVQAGLLPPTHPAALYGDPGVEKCGFPKMMGDAWYTLRSTAASPYQWSIFSSVLLMIFVFMMSLASMVFNFSAGFITTASAQLYTDHATPQYIFSNPLGDTDIKSIQAPQAPCQAGASGTPLCRVIPPEGNPHGDYAIYLLDSMLRAGASNNASANAGPLQIAVGALMEIYNAGILFVAACMLFWLVVSVVVDIARTGQVGGGRHNLVWAPIRIVFALGMMVPLGPTGFSTGQFVVMKLAEWGSNFGSNGWNAYLTKIMQGAKVVPDLPLGEGLEPLVASYERLWICKVAHNGYGYQSEGDAFTTPNLDQFVQLRLETGSVDKGTASYTYTNATAGALCGRVTFPTGNDPILQGTLHPPAGATQPDPLAVAQAQFKYDMDQAWMKLFINGYTPGMQPTDSNNPSANLDQNLPLATLAKKFACGFVAQHIWGKVNDKPVLYIDCSGEADPEQGNLCGAGKPGSGKYPDMSCVDDGTVGELNTDTMTGLIASRIMETARGRVSQLQNWAAQNPQAIFGQRGWADMGGFYKNITTLTGTVKYALAIPVKITPPGQDSSDNQSLKVHEVLAKFDDWLNSVPKNQPIPNIAPECGNDPPPPSCPSRSHAGWNPASSLLSFGKTALSNMIPGLGLITGGSDLLGTLGKAISMVSTFKDDPAGSLLNGLIKMESVYQGTSFLGIPDPRAEDHIKDYPLQILANVGIFLLKMSEKMIEAITVVEIAAAIWPGLGATITTSTLAHLVNALTDVLMGCGMILVYYLPVMPYIRVAHAVLTWMIAVFEAVMLVPIACLSFLDTEKEGMYSKLPFINWLDILVRPILTVIGYVGAILVFDAFFAYLQASFAHAASAEVADQGVMFHFLAMFANSVLFCFLAYTAANTSFKMISLIPDAFFRWLPGGQHSQATGMPAPEAGGVMQQFGGVASKGMSAGALGMKESRQREELRNPTQGDKTDLSKLPPPPSGGGVTPGPKK